VVVDVLTFNLLVLGHVAVVLRHSDHLAEGKGDSQDGTPVKGPRSAPGAPAGPWGRTTPGQVRRTGRRATYRRWTAGRAPTGDVDPVSAQVARRSKPPQNRFIGRSFGGNTAIPIVNFLAIVLRKRGGVKERIRTFPSSNSSEMYERVAGRLRKPSFTHLSLGTVSTKTSHVRESQKLRYPSGIQRRLNEWKDRGKRKCDAWMATCSKERV
jgi:hypothetical protein